MSVITNHRNATMTELVAMLRDEQSRKVDVVVPASQLSVRNGNLIVKGIEPQITADGVDMVDGSYLPTEVCDEGIAAKLDIPRAYLRRMRDSRIDLYDANVGGWLQGRKPLVRGGEVVRESVDPDARSFMLRTFRAQRGDGGVGVARALLSNRYGIVDNLDALTAVLAGVRQTGVNVDIESCDLTDRRMQVRISCPEVSALAPVLLKNYTSPFSGNKGADNPTVFAGFVISNSETGSGQWKITPRLIVEVCKNGMQITKDALAGTHLGSRLEEGAIRWSEDTATKTVELMQAKAADAVRTFLDVDYVTGVIEALETKSTKKLRRGNTAEQIAVVTKKLAFTKEAADLVLDFFMESGDRTAGGVMHAVTAAAQALPNADEAATVEAAGMAALELAFTL